MLESGTSAHVTSMQLSVGVDKLPDATSDCVYKRTLVWDLIRTFGQTSIPGSSNYRIVCIYDAQPSDNHPAV